MNKKSTLVGKSIIVLTALFSLLTFSSSAQLSPSLKFVSPVLVSGTAGQQGAKYKFTNVIPGVDAFAEIKKLKNGAVLINIDETSFGYYDAWQPVVGGPNTAGNDSYIRWKVEFKTTAGQDYTFTSMDLSAIDIDGDNVKVKEYIRVKGHSTYIVPAISLMQMSLINLNILDGSGDLLPELQGVGPIANRADIDTLAMDVRVNYKFLAKKDFEVTTGSIVSNNGYTGAVATDRYSSLYFKYISTNISVLPVTYTSFTVFGDNKTASLNWVTDTEKANDHFEVERSFNQTDFRTIGIVLDAQSASTTGKKYSFKDQSTDLIGQSVAYYRLKQVDIDGRYTYSVVKMVRFNSTTKPFVQVSPNPYMESLNVNFVSEANGKAVVRLVSLSGGVTTSVQESVNKGYNNIQLNNLSSLAPGMYIVDITVDGKVIDRQKVVKQ